MEDGALTRRLERTEEGGWSIGWSIGSRADLARRNMAYSWMKPERQERALTGH